MELDFIGAVNAIGASPASSLRTGER